MTLYVFRSPKGVWGLSVYRLTKHDLERVDTFPTHQWQIISYKRRPRNWPKLERGQCVRRKFTMEER